MLQGFLDERIIFKLLLEEDIIREENFTFRFSKRLYKNNILDINPEPFYNERNRYVTPLHPLIIERGSWKIRIILSLAIVALPLIQRWQQQRGKPLYREGFKI